jgi:hypothetical protein
MLSKEKTLLTPTLERCESIMKRPWDVATLDDYVSIFINRNWYIMIQDYINERAESSEKLVEFWEILDMMKMWILQFYYGTTSKRLFDKKDEWYRKARTLKISYERYNMLLKKLGSDFPSLDVFEGTEEEENTGTSIWGNFDQFNPIVTKLEEHIAGSGELFIFPNIDITIDDDKLRHSSRKFREEGLQITGFRGSRIGPVMNGMGIVQNGLVISIHFSRHGDSAGTVVESLYQKVGYGLGNTLRNKMDACVIMDRGYHTSSGIKFVMKMGCSFLGTHSEKVGGWPFGSGRNGNETDQRMIPSKGVRACVFAQRKALSVQCFAACYRNGSSSEKMGNIHSNLCHIGVWELQKYVEKKE